MAPQFMHSRTYSVSSACLALPRLLSEPQRTTLARSGDSFSCREPAVTPQDPVVRPASLEGERNLDGEVESWRPRSAGAKVLAEASLGGIQATEATGSAIRRSADRVRTGVLAPDVAA